MKSLNVLRLATLRVKSKDFYRYLATFAGIWQQHCEQQALADFFRRGRGEHGFRGRCVCSGSVKKGKVQVFSANIGFQGLEMVSTFLT